ncbi:MAG: thioesterase family protein [Cyclobacteriaceae bacterium]
MRWIRLVAAMVSAKFKTKLSLSETVVLPFRVWVTDIDVSVMNHAAIMTVMELGRIDFMVRTNFLKLARKYKWFYPSQAISVQFYKPLKMFQKAELLTRVSFIDEKWIYMEQKIVRNGKDVAACLVKGTIKKGRATVPTSEIANALGIDQMPDQNYDLIDTFQLENEQMNERMTDWRN